MKYSPVTELPILAGLTPAAATLTITAPSQPVTGIISDPVVAPKSTIAPPPVILATPVVEEAVMAPPVVNAADVAASSDTVTISVAEQVPPVELPTGDVTERWEKTLNNLVEDSQSSMVAMLRTAKPMAWEPPVLRIGVQFKFHYDQLTRQKNRAILEAALAKTFGTAVQVDIMIQPVDDLATAAEEIFA
jgi:hypothetical protein